MAHIDIGQNSIIQLFSNVDISDGHQIAFSSPSAQSAYFNKHLVDTISNTSYLYKNKTIKIQRQTILLENCNYIAFRNPNFENRVIFARITDYNYVNNVTVEITYAIDWFQTYMFDVDYQSTEIMREMLSQADWQTAQNNPWVRNIPELSSAEAFSFNDEDWNVVNSENKHLVTYPDPTVFQDIYTIIIVSDMEFDDEDYPDLSACIARFRENKIESRTSSWQVGCILSEDQVDGFPSAVSIYFAHPHALYKEEPLIKAFVNNLTKAGLSHSIQGIYSVPKYILDSIFANRPYAKTPITLENPISLCTEGENPKLKRFPFSYIRASVWRNIAREYKYEHFLDPTHPEFGVMSAISDGLHSIMYPINYKKSGANLEERLDIPPMPQIAFTTDAFLTYLGEQYRNSMLQSSWPKSLGRVAKGVLGGGVQLALGNILGGVTQMADSIVDSVSNSSRTRMLADQLNGNTSWYNYDAEKRAYIADEYHPASSPTIVNLKTKSLSVEVEHRTLQPSKAYTIDRYFDAFGYNSGRIGVPRICNFIKGYKDPNYIPTWRNIDGKLSTYIQTGGMQVISNMKPVSDYIQTLFNKGCRFLNGDLL